MEEEQEEEHTAFKYLGKCIDDLPPDVYEIEFSPDGAIVSTSNDPKDDMTRCVFHPPLTSLNPDVGCVVTRADLVEVDRLCSNVDLVVRPESATLQSADT